MRKLFGMFLKIIFRRNKVSESAKQIGEPLQIEDNPEAIFVQSVQEAVMTSHQDKHLSFGRHVAEEWKKRWPQCQGKTCCGKEYNHCFCNDHQKHCLSKHCWFWSFSYWPVGSVAACTTFGLWLANIWPLWAGIIGFCAMALMPGISIVKIISSYVKNRRFIKKEIAYKLAYLQRSSSKDSAVCIIERYRRILSRHREQLIGTGTPFERILAHCSDLRAKSTASGRYWEERVRELKNEARKPEGNVDLPFAERKVDDVKSLAERISIVLEKLEARKRALLEHFEKEGNRLPVVTSILADYFETRRLEELKDAVGMVEERADEVCVRVFHDFVRDVRRLQSDASMLGILSHKALAEPRLDLPLLENLADRICDHKELTEETLSVS